jgi:hypothetical protein
MNAQMSDMIKLYGGPAAQGYKTSYKSLANRSQSRPSPHSPPADAARPGEPTRFAC